MNTSQSHSVGNNSQAEISSANPRIDPILTSILVQASIAAYNDYEGKQFSPPPNYKFFARFTGWDDVIDGYGKEERYGLIFQYCGTQQIANRFIVAFRGTDSYADMIEDAFWERSVFLPYRNTISPVPNDVCSGFNGIYATKGGSMTASMQQQIFSVLPAKPSEVLITGHSLGGALSQLFTLDMCASFPNVRINTVNFASPRVGGHNWSAACNNSGATSKITRVINYYDYVPDFPQMIIDNYLSIGVEFQTAFYGKDIFPFDELARHRILNLQVVLNNCLSLIPQVWEGTFGDAVTPTYRMTSVAPPAISKNVLVNKLAELHALEKSIHATSSSTTVSKNINPATLNS